MHDLFKNIKAVGFDLDGTLYKTTPEMNEMIRGEISKKVLDKKPELETYERAREFVEEKYRELESGSKTLISSGYKPIEALRMMEKILIESDFNDLISEDAELVAILNELKDKFYSYLVTKSPVSVAKKKLSKIGIHDNHFDAEFFGDDDILFNKTKIEALQKISEISGIPLENHVYIGDRVKSDVVEPKSIGMKTIAVWKEIPEADVSVSDIHMIKDILL